MKTRVFTTGVVFHQRRILILKRKQDDDTYPGFWDCVGGHFEEGESAEECMLREAKEESGQSMTIVRVGPLIEYLDDYGRAVAVPFLLKHDPGKAIRPTEHSAFRWVSLGDVKKYDIVPDLEKALDLFGLGASSAKNRSPKSGLKGGPKRASGLPRRMLHSHY
jgi:8-oxo-dGTP diphosphatase